MGAEKQKVQTRTLKIAQIIDEDATQTRVALDEGVAAEYAQLMRDGHNFPPVEVVHDKKAGKFYLTDGFHRLHAARSIGVETIGAIVHEGTLDEARWLACGANKSHGLRRTNADKRKAIRSALMARPHLSDVVLSFHVGVSQSAMSSYRRELASAGVIPQVDVRITADGKQRNVTDMVKTRKDAIAAAAAKRGPKAKYEHCPRCRGSGMVKVGG